MREMAFYAGAEYDILIHNQDGGFFLEEKVR
jgi:hypothetical protein